LLVLSEKKSEAVLARLNRSDMKKWGRSRSCTANREQPGSWAAADSYGSECRGDWRVYEMGGPEVQLGHGAFLGNFWSARFRVFFCFLFLNNFFTRFKLKQTGSMATTKTKAGGKDAALQDRPQDSGFRFSSDLFFRCYNHDHIDFTDQ